jgi:hypothetical protein
MIRSLLVGSLLLAGAITGFAQPAAIYINDTATAVTNVDVDATIFLNRGYFQADGAQFGSDALWESSNTRYFTNSGIMTGTPGFRFDYMGYDGYTNPASAFLNTRTGSILATDLSSLGGVTIGGIGVGNLFGLNASSRIEISADTVTNQGLISASAGGIIKIDGNSVDLSGSGVIIESLADSGATAGFFTGFGGFVGNTGGFNGFIPDVGIYDLAWGISSDTNMFLGTIVQAANPASVISPPFQVTNTLTGFNGTGTTFNLGCFAQLSLQNAAPFVLVQSFSATNLTVQVVIVKLTDTNIVPQVNFIDTGGQFLPAVVELDSKGTNLFTRQQVTNSLFLIDELPTVSPTNYTLLQNFGSQSVGTRTFRPVNFTLTRLSPFFFGFGGLIVPTNDVLTTSLLSNGAYSNAVVTNIYAGYSAQVESSAARLPALPNVSYKDRPGRVEINADDLNLNRARIRGEGLVSITASNFVGAPRALIDAQHLNYNLTSRNDLPVTNLAPDTVQRLAGPISAYSAIWTNQFGTVSLVGTNSVTNVTEVKFHLLLVDGSGLGTIQPVTVHDLNLRSPSAIDLQDNLFVSDSLRIDTANLTVHSHLELDPSVPLDATTLIGVQNLTNYGRISLPTLASFGGNTNIGSEGPPGTLTSLINRGSIESLGTFVRSDYFENSGTIVSTNNSRFFATNDFCLQTVQEFTNFSSSIGAIEINARIAKYAGGTLGTDGDVRLLGGTSKFNNQSILAGGGLYFGADNVLTDTGSDAGNLWRTGDGVHMEKIPVNKGNLLGTRIIASAPDFSIIHSTWGSTDFGTNVSGFTNNMAIGQLILDSGFAAQFEFSGTADGTSSRKAIYVDQLVLRGDIATDLSSFRDALSLNNIDLYYADVVCSNPDINAESLDGLILNEQSPSGTSNLHWARYFAGPNSSVDVVIVQNGQAISVPVNRALRFSTRIDSDSDGIPNAYDSFPFNPAMPQITNISVAGIGGQVKITFNAEPGGTYRVESASSLISSTWQLVSVYQNTGTQTVTRTVTDPSNATAGSRFYRVTYNP